MSELLDQIDLLNGALGATDELETMYDEVSIGALVKKGKIAPAAAKDVAKVVNSSVKRRLLNSTYTRDQRFLLSQAGKLGIDTKIAWARGESQFTLKDLYFRRRLQGGAQESLVKASDIEEVGVQNVQGNSLPEGQNMVVSAMKIAYAYHASDANPRTQAYTNAMDAETAGSSPVVIPAAILNGEIEFRTEGTTVLRLPVKRFFRESFSVGVGVEGGADSVQLPAPVFLKSKQAFEIILWCTNGIALPANNHFLEVRLMGSGLMGRR